MLFALDILQVQLPATVALAAVAVIGYFVGRHQRMKATESSEQARREMKRAQAIARDLEQITQEVRKNLARHHASIARFKLRVGELSTTKNEAAWKDLCQEAEEILGPTMQLAAHIAQAYDQIRQQSNQLMTFTEVRTDALTGVSNRRAMDDTLQSLVAMKNRYQLSFSLAIFDIDHFKSINDQQGHLAGDQMLQQVARLIDETARETDIVTRYGGEEFVVLMPQTELGGATIFSERVRQAVERKLGITLSAGAAEANDGELSDEVLHRADAALYHAKSGGRNRVSRHTGQVVEAVSGQILAAPPPVAAVPV